MKVIFKEDFQIKGIKPIKAGAELNVCADTFKYLSDLGVIEGSRKKRKKKQQEIIEDVIEADNQNEN